ncbi:hypothetical protein IAR50_000002 [Cryptococcus sp. DSM 104548]
MKRPTSVPSKSAKSLSRFTPSSSKTSLPSAKPSSSRDKGKSKVSDHAAKRARIVSSEDELESDSSGLQSPSDSGSSEDESGDEEDGEARRAAQLAALEAHSRALLGLPPLPTASRPADDDISGEYDDEDQESGEEEGEGEEFESDDGWGAEDGFVSDSEDEFAVQAPTTQQSKPNTPATETSNVPVVVFDQPSAASTSTLSKAERRAFLNGTSTKMMGIASTPDYPPSSSRKRSRQTAEEDDEDATAASLDKSLHSMLLNSLLPEHASSLASRPVDKRNAMSARLLELANYELPGEGSKVMKTQHLSKHSAKIRTGMVHKQEARDKAKRQEAIESGNHVRGMSSLGEGLKKSGGKASQRAMMGMETGKKKGMESRKKGDEDRSRGLGMGVGRFAGGMLKLSKSEIDGVNGDMERRRESSRGGRGGRGRGGRGGRGGGGRGGGRGGKR